MYRWPDSARAEKRKAVRGPRKIYRISHNVYCAVSGLFSDALRIINISRLKCQEVLEEFDVECSVETLAKRIGEVKQSLTQSGGLRPFGVSLIYGGVKNGEYMLFSTDPSGAVNRWKCICYGENEDAINSAMRTEMCDKEFNLEQATRKIFEVLASVREFGEKEASIIEVLHFKESEKSYLKTEHVSAIISEIQTSLKAAK